MLDHEWLGGEVTHEDPRDLAGSILVIDPIERKSAGEVAVHRWLLDRSREEDPNGGSQLNHEQGVPADIQDPQVNFTTPLNVDSES